MRANSIYSSAYLTKYSTKLNIRCCKDLVFAQTLIYITDLWLTGYTVGHLVSNRVLKYFEKRVMQNKINQQSFLYVEY